MNTTVYSKPHKKPFSQRHPRLTKGLKRAGVVAGTAAVGTAVTVGGLVGLREVGRGLSARSKKMLEYDMRKEAKARAISREVELGRMQREQTARDAKARKNWLEMRKKEIYDALYAKGFPGFKAECERYRGGVTKGELEHFKKVCRHDAWVRANIELGRLEERGQWSVIRAKAATHEKKGKHPALQKSRGAATRATISTTNTVKRRNVRPNKKPVPRGQSR